VLKVRATPVLEDSTTGTTVEVYADSYRYDPENAATPAEQLEQQLVATTADGDEYRFALIAHRNGDWITGHTIEIEPVPDPVPDVDDQRDQELQDALDEVLAEEQRKADELRDQITMAAEARGWDHAQLLADFANWPGSGRAPWLDANFVVLGDYLEHLQRTAVN
jgi:hypothetical protein